MYSGMAGLAQEHSWQKPPVDSGFIDWGFSFVHALHFHVVMGLEAFTGKRGPSTK